MNRYETVFLSHQDLSEEDIEALTGQAVEILQQNSGELIQVQQWGKKKLAYKIKKENRAYYTLLDYTSGGEAILALERMLRLSDKVLKYLTIKQKDITDLEEVRRAIQEAQEKVMAPPPAEEAPPAEESPAAEASEAPSEETAPESDDVEVPVEQARIVSAPAAAAESAADGFKDHTESTSEEPGDNENA